MTESTEEQAALHKELGITSNTVTTYRYKSHVYQKLSDAVKYAELDRASDTPDEEPPVYDSK